MRTLYGPLDRGVWMAPDGDCVERVSFGGEILTVPEGSDKWIARRTAVWFGIASSGHPFTLDVDDDQVIRRFRLEHGEYSVEFSLPDGPIQFTVPEDLRAASG